MVILALKILGIALAVIVGLVLSALGLLLFVPVRYSAHAEAEGKDFSAAVNASWLLHILRLRYAAAPGYSDLRLKLLWFTVNLDDEPEDKGEGAGAAETPRASANEPGLAERVRGLWAQAAYYKNYPDRDVILRATWRLIKQLCKAAKPRRFSLNAEVGLESPDQTGYFMAGMGIISLSRYITPNFQKKVMRVDVTVGGALNLWSILWPLFKYIVKRPIWKITKKILSGR